MKWPNIEVTDNQQLQQRWWSEHIGKKEHTRLLDKVSPRDQARIMEQQNGIGGSFMAATPSRTALTKISSDQYSLGLRWRLGLQLFPEGTDPSELVL